MTLSIVRNASFRPGYKQKLYYHENVYRPAGSSHQFREIMQCGLECIGDLDNYDVYEVLHLAAESLRTISKHSVLSVSHLGILKSLFSDIGAGERAQGEVLRLIAARNEHELAELFRQQGWAEERFSELRALLGLRCSLKELPEKLGSEIAEKVISGGRYDSLLKRMNRKGSAIGFAVYLGILDQLLRTNEAYDADVLLLYDEDTPLSLVRDTEKELQRNGRSVSAQRSADDGRYGETVDLRGGEKDA